ncbi:MAG: hypothetical protein IJ518_07350 [Clostridia bacterium]|nr:hypothetical protein [Clostridia bacterium]
MAKFNEAYDLELFQPREPRLVALKNDAKTIKETKRRNRRQSLANVVVYLSLALVAMALVGYFITCNVRLTEMNKALSDGQAQLNALHSEQVRLQSELAGLTSAEKINQYALENGLLPMDSNQIYYITANEEDQVSLAEEQDNWFVTAWNAVVDFLS